MSRKRFSSSSCGSLMRKPTETPPASRAPRFAASITPGPPPVMTAKPSSANVRPVRRACSYIGLLRSIRAEPKIVAPGRPIRSTALKPSRNSNPILAACSTRSGSIRSRMRRSSVSCRGINVPPGGVPPLLASEKQARQGRRERPYAGIRARLRTPHGAALQPPEVLRTSPGGALKVPRDVRRVHGHDEECSQSEIDRRDRRALPRPHAVVLLELWSVARAPALPGLHPSSDEDDQQDRVGEEVRERREPDEPDQPHRRMERSDGAAAVERDDRQQVEQVDQEPDEGERLQEPRVHRHADRPDRRRARGSEQGAGERDLSLLPGVLRHLLHADERSEEGNEERGRCGDPLPAELEHVADLVHEDQADEPEAEPPAAEQRVGANGDDHRGRDGEDLELRDREEQELELGKERADRRERRPELAGKAAPGRLWLDRLVAAFRLFEGVLVERLVRGPLGRPRYRLHLSTVPPEPTRDARCSTSYATAVPGLLASPAAAVASSTASGSGRTRPRERTSSKRSPSCRRNASIVVAYISASSPLIVIPSSSSSASAAPTSRAARSGSPAASVSSATPSRQWAITSR